MRKEYLEELEALKTKMEKAEAFAEKLPVFAEHILSYKLSGDEDWSCFGKQYKKIPLHWGIKRGFYKSGGNRYVNNYPKNTVYAQHFFCIYINTIDLFNEHNNFDLHQYIKNVDVFFADECNSTFYVTDEHIHAFLEAMNTWYCDALLKLEKHNLQQKEAKLKKELKEIQARLGDAQPPQAA